MLALRATPPLLATFALLVTGSLSHPAHEPTSEPNDHATYGSSLSQAATEPDIRTFPDAQPWPHGMVIAPRIADSMAIAPDRSADAGDWPHGMVIGRRDTLLSALFAPLAESLLAPGPALL